MEDQHMSHKVLDVHAPLMRWHQCDTIFNIYEVDTKILQALLPPPLHTVEVRPGTSMLTVSWLRYQDGNMDGTVKAFDELVMYIVVPPDLSVEMPTPRFTFYPLNILSNEVAFVVHERKRLHLPAHLDNSLTCMRHGDHDFELTTADGPIFRLAGNPPDPVFHHDMFWGQFYTLRDGQLHRGFWSWEGKVCEHQRPDDDPRLFQHAFFGDLEVSKVGRSLHATSCQTSHPRDPELLAHGAGINAWTWPHGRCLTGVDFPSDESPELIAVDKQPDDQIVRAFRLGKTDCATHQPLNRSYAGVENRLRCVAQSLLQQAPSSGAETERFAFAQGEITIGQKVRAIARDQVHTSICDLHPMRKASGLDPHIMVDPPLHLLYALEV
jgi:hypothetical protein